MQVLWNGQRIDLLGQRIDRVEQKLDEGFAATQREFAAVRSEARADFRLLLGILLTMFMAMILGFAGILLQNL